MGREVYIGNGETIIVTPNLKEAKRYDFKKLQTLLDSGKKIEVGMKEDWYWTAVELTQEVIDSKKVAGIDGSDWATPSVEIEGKMEDCYIIEKI